MRRGLMGSTLLLGPWGGASVTAKALERDSISAEATWEGGKTMDDTQNMYDVRPELEQLAEDTFAFLVSEKGWTRGRTEKSATASTTYYKQARFVGVLGLEVTIDFRDESVDVNLVKLDAGKVPAHGHDENESGVIRRRIELVLPDVLRVKDRRVDAVVALLKTRKPWERLTAQALLRTYGELVTAYIDRLSQQPIDILFPPSRKRSR